MSFLVIANGCNGYNQTVIYTIVNGDLGYKRLPTLV